jgi:parvulin-like peptidyl-prolyl isomerase
MMGRICLLAAAVMVGMGCHGETATEPLSTKSFYGHAVEPPESPAQEIDKAGPIQTGAERVDVAPATPPVPAVQPGDPAAQPAKASRNPVTPGAVAPLPSDDVTSEAPMAASRPGTSRPVISQPDATDPATRPTHHSPETTRASASTEPLPEGGFQIVGFVVAEVNGHPIFADEIIEQLNSALAAEARKNSRDRFKAVARQLIERQLGILISNELEVAAAENRLKASDKKIADLMTAQWRTQEITKAGGSVQMARENYKAQGKDFDKEAHRQYRQNLVQVFNHQNVWPLIQVSADDMRTYYARNITDFTEDGEAVFRLIKIDPALHGGRDAAEALAKQIYARAKTEDFATLAGSDVNDDKTARASGGLLQPLKKGSYVLEKVEAAVWQTKPGQITDIVTDRGGFYIAKVESIKPGRKQAFDDLAVQSRITATLRSQQYQKLRYDYIDRLRKDAVVRGGSPAQVSVVLDMAMQGYTHWTQ